MSRDAWVETSGSICLTVWGAPRTKKTHNRIMRRKETGKPFVMPSKQWVAWRDNAVVVPDGDHSKAVFGAGAPRIAYTVNCRALFYRDAARGDALGYYQGLADLLQHHRVVADDMWIESWDGSRLLLAAHPRLYRVVVELTPTHRYVEPEDAA